MGWDAGLAGKWVFPTHVGVFPVRRFPSQPAGSLPHACGGVSKYELGKRKPLGVFPTHVGVFPKSYAIYVSIECLPHACGGVSSR